MSVDPMDEIDIIRETRQLLTNPTKWCGNGAFNDSGFCLGLTLNHTASQLFGDVSCGNLGRAHLAVREHLPAGFTNIPGYNDDPGTTHADILSLLDKTLADLGGLG